MDNTGKLVDKELSDTKTKDKDIPNVDDVDGATDIIEGLTTREGYGFIAGLLILTIPLAVYYIKTIYDAPYRFFKSDFSTVINGPNYDKERFVELYDEYITSLRNNKFLNHKWVLLWFLGFSYMAFLVNLEDENLKEPAKWVMASIVGCTLFIFKFIPSIINFYENTFGYFFMNLFGSIDLSLSLKNDNFKDGDAKIKLNKLMTIFNIENLGKKFNQIGIYNKEQKDDRTLFAVFNENNDTSTCKLFEYLLNRSIMKRAIGETTLLVFSTLITVSLFKHYEGFG